MQSSRGHSRNESGDSAKLFSESQEFAVDEDNFLPDVTLEPSLLFHQPKLRLTCGSFPALARQALREFFKLYVHPVVALFALLMAIAVPIGMCFWHPTTEKLLIIDKSLQSFQIPGHISSQHEDMVSVASKLSKIMHHPEDIWHSRRKKRSAGSPDTNFNTEVFQKSPKWTLELVYLARGENDSDLNIFTKERLETIHQIEQSLMQQDGFSDFCWKWPEAKKDPFLPDGCTPPISLIDFFYPSVGPGLLVNDGQGHGKTGKMNLTDARIKESFDLLLTKPFTYWFVDGSFSSSNRKSKFLRAEVRFGYPLKPSTYKYWNYPGVHDPQGEAFKDFLVKYAEAVKKMSTDKVRVLYGGKQIFDYEVDKTLWADVHLSLFSLAFVFAFLFVFTRFSPFLTVLGVISILSPILLAYFFFHLVVDSLGILSGISMFIIIGIGVDDVFVFINTFRQARSAKSLESRLAHTLVTAGKATFFTSFTTFVAFFANYFSEIPAVSDFGLYMALIVICCWCTVICTLLPALNLWHRYISKCEELTFHHVFGWLNCSCGGRNSSLPDDIEQFLAGTYSNTRQNELSSSVEGFELLARTPLQNNDDDDDALLILDDSSQSPCLSSSDADLAMYDDPSGTFDHQTVPLVRHAFSEPRPIPVAFSRSCGSGLQEVLYHWLALPIKKCPYVVLGGFLIILGVSIGLDTQIQASSTPPSFFKEDSNLQQMWNLRYNMSSDSLNVHDLTGELIVERLSNEIDTPTSTSKPRRRKPSKANGIRSTAPSPVTAPQPGHDPKKNMWKIPSSSTKSSTSSSKPTVVLQTTSTPQPRSKKISTLKAPTKHTKKPIASENPPPAPKRPKSDNSGNVGTTKPPEGGTPPRRCPGNCDPIAKPIVDSSATVYVILGLKAIDRSKIIRESVFTEKGDVIPDYAFSEMVKKEHLNFLKYACKLCKRLSNNSELVRPGGADCFPSWIIDSFPKGSRHDPWGKHCADIKVPEFSSGKSRAKLLQMSAPNGDYTNGTYWMKMAFESTVFSGKSSWERVEDFDKWNKFLKEELRTYPKGFHSAFQTSSEWVNTFTEVIAINSAIYGIVFSIVLCLGSVAIFTANGLLTLIVSITILGVLTSVVAIFYVASWQLGAVEAISLSILVGTSVDYCVHLVEGYILAGNAIPPDLTTSKEIRGWRTVAAMSHVGTAIVSSAITTVVASIPLCVTTIQLFAKFGQILAINTAVSIFFTLSICVALLCLIAPARFKASGWTTLKALVTVLTVYGVGALILFLINWKAVRIPGPSGEPLFPIPE
ncbi:protein dispatched homolog 3-like [Montipora foliosa]|uniref:protein dispatched homolog 3-like n=1 Tax=Montipora foliosa TaxID=591990 RepID=UPI0035F141EA